MAYQHGRFDAGVIYGTARRPAVRAHYYIRSGQPLVQPRLSVHYGNNGYLNVCPSDSEGSCSLSDKDVRRFYGLSIGGGLRLALSRDRRHRVDVGAMYRVFDGGRSRREMEYREQGRLYRSDRDTHVILLSNIQRIEDSDLQLSIGYSYTFRSW